MFTAKINTLGIAVLETESRLYTGRVRKWYAKNDLNFEEIRDALRVVAKHIRSIKAVESEHGVEDWADALKAYKKAAGIIREVVK